MKKKVAKKLRELAEHIPPVVMFEPKKVVKTGKELNEIIDQKAEEHYEALPWYEKIKVAIKQHGADLGIVEPLPEPKHYDEEQLYTQKRPTPKLVNHYKNLKREWEQYGQEGITRYAVTMADINRIQTDKNGNR